MGKVSKKIQQAYVLEWSQEEWEGAPVDPFNDDGTEPEPIEVHLFRMEPSTAKSLGKPVITITIRDRKSISSIASSLKNECAGSLSMNKRESIALLFSALCKEQLCKAEDGAHYKNKFTDNDVQEFWQASKKLVFADIPKVIREKGRFTFTTIPAGYFTDGQSVAWSEQAEIEEIVYFEEQEKFERELNPGVKVVSYPNVAEIAESGNVKSVDLSQVIVDGELLKLRAGYMKIVSLMLKEKILSFPGLHQDDIFKAIDPKNENGYWKNRMDTFERPNVNGKVIRHPGFDTVIKKGGKASFFLNPGPSSKEESLTTPQIITVFITAPPLSKQNNQPYNAPIDSSFSF